MVEDLYSLEGEASPEINELNSIVESENLSDTLKISDVLQVPELENGSILNTEMNAIIDKQDVRNGKIIYEGTAKIKLLYNTNGSINLKELSMQFNYELISNAINENSDITTEINIKNDNFVLQDRKNKCKCYSRI